MDVTEFLKNLEKNNLDDYIVIFDSIFVISTLHDSFLAFLKTEFNSEPLEFIDAIKSLESTYKINWVNSVIKILDTFIKIGSSKELNLSGQVRSQVLEYFEGKNLKKSSLLNFNSWSFDKTPVEIFASLKKTVQMQLFLDSWPRYVRTEGFTKDLLKLKKNEIPLAISYKKNNEFNFTKDDFIRGFIDDKDFNFFKSLLEDSFQWELIYSSPQDRMNTFISQKSYLNKVDYFKGSGMVKFETILKENFEHVIIGLLQSNFLKSPLMTDIQLLFKKSSSELLKEELKYNSDAKCSKERTHLFYLNDVETQAGLLLYPYSISYYYDDEFLMLVQKPCVLEETKDMVIGKPYTKMFKESGKEKKMTKNVSLLMKFESTIIQKIGDETVVTSFVCPSFGKNDSQLYNFNKQNAIKRSKGFIANFKNQLEKVKDRTIETAHETLSKDPLGELILEQFKDNVPSHSFYNLKLE